MDKVQKPSDSESSSISFDVTRTHYAQRLVCHENPIEILKTNKIVPVAQ
jgi:hypothetical protein